ncbi:MBL fold metallo-hydrolase [Desulfogranum mediterraneum]|uniref:MBL fold metallo-hydrolase n=1 Tax=Desulfogranum mediterraneum TaxID=160661 RepID=UPI00042170BA|nr:MBL fold metallo-hydrolase [Desulfogranum mediterraneum]
MKVCVLGSGSKGNCTLVTAGSSRLLIDAGFSGKEVERRLALVGCAPESLDSILVTHEHHDHIAGVGVLARRYGLTVYLNELTYQAAEDKLGRVDRLRAFSTGDPFALADLRVHPFAVSHDCADPVGFVVSSGRQRLGYCTDTGRLTKLIHHHLRSCSTLVLEANHDPEMLRNGPYPLSLQQRIQSHSGHLANSEAVRFAAELAGQCLQRLVLAHISETNNHVDRVSAEVRRHLQVHSSLEVELAVQGGPTSVIRVAE